MSGNITNFFNEAAGNSKTGLKHCVLTYSARSSKESCRTPITQEAENEGSRRQSCGNGRRVKIISSDNSSKIGPLTFISRHFTKDVYVFPWTKVPY